MANTLLGNPEYQVTSGRILFKGEDITAWPTDVRGKAGIFLAFQYPEEIPGVPVTTNESKYPLVIYAHGHLGTRTDNTRKVENLVSHGFIVLALDHINCGAITLQKTITQKLQA